MDDAIRRALQEIEETQDVRVLYAVESGSRAWGFASQDSDFDVRFIYAHSVEWYLSVEERRDVIERFLPGDLDVSGWELRKALRLMRKSNPPLLEWLFSPIVYLEEPDFATELRSLALAGWSPKHCMHHYLSMANGNFRTYLQGERVRSKKYLYVLRPLLACRWIERTSTLPPVDFREMLQAEEDREVVSAVQALLERKAAGAELDDAPKDPVLDSFIIAELARYGSQIDVADRKMDVAGLDRIFRTWVMHPRQTARHR